MFRIATTLALITASLFPIASSLLTAPAPTPEPAAVTTVDVTPEPVVTVDRLAVEIDDPEWAALVEWALDRYSDIGLEMPSGLITRSTDPAYCSGNSGLYVPGELPEVRFCVDGDSTSKVSRLIVLHELGHLWAEERMDDDAKAEFLETRSLSAWIDGDLPRHEWGAEHAAEVLSWGLMDEPVRIIRIYNASPDALGEAFRVLTGTEPLVEA